MKKRVIQGMMLTLLLVGMLALTFNIQPLKAEVRPYATTGIWIGGSDPTGWYKVDPQGNTIVPMQGFWYLDHNQQMAYNPVDKTVWWITFWGDRAIKIDKNGNVLRNVHTGRGVQGDIKIDPRDGSVWIVTGGGPFEGWLIKLDAEGNKLFEKPLGWRPGAGGQSAVWLYQDSVWVNTNDGRVLKFDLNGNLILQIDSWYEEGIHDIVVNEKDGTVWFSTRFGRLFKLNQQGEILLTKQLPIETGQTFGLDIDTVTGHVWFIVSYIGKVIKVDQAGNILFEKKYDYLFVPGRDTTISKIVVDPADGGAIIPLGPSARVVKVDPSGDVVFVVDAPFSFGVGCVAVEYETIPVITATVDIDPQTLNLKSNGEFITAYIELPAGYNVADIDLTTVQLEGISAITDPKYSFVTYPSQYLVDHDGDGIMERMVKFDRETVRTHLTSEPDYEETPKFYDIILKVTGKIAGTIFEGTDTIRVIKK